MFTVFFKIGIRCLKIISITLTIFVFVLILVKIQLDYIVKNKKLNKVYGIIFSFVELFLSTNESVDLINVSARVYFCIISLSDGISEVQRIIETIRERGMCTQNGMARGGWGRK